MTSHVTNLPPLPGEAPAGPVALDLATLDAWGEALGRALVPGTLVTLAGDLGAGKTTLAQAICRGYGVREPVTSPTFALVQRYEGSASSIHHFDLYRLRDARDLAQIGWDEILDAGGVTLVEWPERAAGALPERRIAIELGHADRDDRRAIRIR